jgi:phytoene/squalene synthetase
LVLALFGYRDPERRQLSDQICTALQITNFLQDVSVDLSRGRIYLPLDELADFGCSPLALTLGVSPQAFQRFVAFQVERAREMFREGLCLADRVERRLGREVRLFAWGGLTVLAQIERSGHDVLQRRPTVPAWRKAALVLQAAVGQRKRGGIS